jgi:sugar phosphate isomerase/epimerase
MIRLGAPVNMPEKAPGPGEDHGAVVDDPRELVLAHKAKGYRAAYAPKVTLKEPEKIKAVREAFAAEDIMIAEVGYWDNIMDLDPKERAYQRANMVNALAIAEELGAKCAVNIFGSYAVLKNGNAQHAARNFSSEAFEDAVDMARYFIDEVKPKTAYFAYEIFPFSVVDTPEMIEKLIWAVDRKQFGVHLDLVNLINCPRAYWNNADIARECVARFGHRIVSAHVKDIKMKEPAISVILNEVICGTGVIDHGTFAKVLHDLPQDIPFMLEHLNSEAEFDQAAAWVRARAAEQGVIL